MLRRPNWRDASYWVFHFVFDSDLNSDSDSYLDLDLGLDLDLDGPQSTFRFVADVNECLDDNGGCDQRCVNENGR